MKILKRIFLLGFVVSFALPMGNGIYGIYIFLMAPFEVFRVLKWDLFHGVTGESLFLFVFAADSKTGLRFRFDTLLMLVLGIVWVSNFTAFFLRRRRVIYFFLGAHVLFFVLLLMASEWKWELPLTYLAWGPSVVGLHVLRLLMKPVAAKTDLEVGKLPH